MLAALAAVHLFVLREQTSQEQEERLVAQLRLIDQGVTRELAAVDEGLRSVARDLPRWDADGHWDRAALRLQALDAVITAARTISLLDAQGRVQASSRAELVGLDLAARQYFITARSDDNPHKLYISPPFRTQLGVWSLNLSRVLRGPDGRFAGVVTATIDPEWLRLVLDTINFAPDMWSAAAHAGGRLLVMTPQVLPDVESVDLARPGSMFVRHLQAGSAETVFRGRLLATGQQRLIAHRSVLLPDVPPDETLILALSRDLDAVQADWRREAAFVGLLFALLLGLSGVGLALMQRSEHRIALAEAAARDELQTMEQRWMIALQSSGLGVWDWDLRGDAIFFSEPWRAMFGPDAGGPGARGRWIERIHPDDRAVATAALEAHLAGRAGGYESEHRLRAAAGGWRWVLSRGQVVERDGQGHPRRMVGTTTDVTDRHEAAALRAAHDRAEAASRAKSEFLSRMSHELRTPLNAVLGFAQLMSARLGQIEIDEQRRYVEHIEKAGWHLLAMINDVLDLSRVESGQLELRREPVALAEVLGDVLGMIGPLVQARSLVLAVGPLPAGAVVQADALRLRQVFTNLLSNAVKYNVEGGRIEVALAAEPGRWRVAVSDTGPGIAAADMEHLFEPFNRLGFTHSAVEGAGIGLVLTRWLVQEMGGTLAVRSTPGVGSTFEVELPAAAPPAA